MSSRGRFCGIFLARRINNRHQVIDLMAVVIVVVEISLFFEQCVIYKIGHCDLQAWGALHLAADGVHGAFVAGP